MSEGKTTLTWKEWDDEIITHFEVHFEMTRSDAQGLVDAQNFAQRQAWSLGLSPADAAEKIWKAGGGK